MKTGSVVIKELEKNVMSPNVEEAMSNFDKEHSTDER